MKLKNIIFDFDGVIVDNYEIIFSLFHQWDKLIDEKVFLDLFNENVIKGIKKRFGSEGVSLLKKFVTNKYTEKIQEMKCFSDVDKNLKKLSFDYNLFIISSGSEKNIHIFLDKHKFNYFRAILGRETAHKKVKKFRILERDFEISSEDTIFITDTLGDVKEAHQAGYKVLAETFGFHDKKRLKKGNPEWLADSWGDLIKIINNIQ
jgi:phosphoglycolate phosphatase